MKNWIDLNTQVQKHIDRGLELGSVSHHDFALFLYSNNYYRVSGYARSLYECGADRYTQGLTADRLIGAYDLDRAVRARVLEGVGFLEPTLKSRVAYHLAKSVGGEGYLAKELYLPKDAEPHAGDDKYIERWHKEVSNRNEVLKSLREIQSRREVFIQHHVEKGDPVPLWAAVEVLSIGTFSRLLRALRDKSVLDPVTKSFGIEDNDKLLQAVQNIAFLRNIAAHHGRLWNRRFDAHVTLPRIALQVKRKYVASKTPAAALTLLAGLVDQINKDTSYSNNLLDLVHSDPDLVDGYYHPLL